MRLERAARTLLHLCRNMRPFPLVYICALCKERASLTRTDRRYLPFLL